MFDKKQIIAMAQHVFNRSGGIPDKRLMHPRREWGIGLLLFAVILMSGSYITASSFNRFRELDTGNGEANVTIPKYNANLVEQVLEEYNTKAITYESLVSDVPVSVVTATSTETVASSTDTISEDVASSSAAVSVEDVSTEEAALD